MKWKAQKIALAVVLIWLVAALSLLLLTAEGGARPAPLATGTAESGRRIGDAETEKEKDLFLPDLVIMPPRQLYISRSGGKRNLRFSTEFINQGRGKFEIVGKPDPNATGTMLAFQVITAGNGSEEEREIGRIILHPGHDHWHLAEYVEIQLWSYDSAGNRLALLSATEKMGFCIYDEKAHDPGLDGAPKAPQYKACAPDKQGLSIGWSDTYEATLEGQELDITSVPDGNYIIRQVLNPESRILEGDYKNNEVSVFIAVGEGINMKEGP